MTLTKSDTNENRRQRKPTPTKTDANENRRQWKPTPTKTDANENRRQRKPTPTKTERQQKTDRRYIVNENSHAGQTFETFQRIFKFDRRQQKTAQHDSGRNSKSINPLPIRRKPNKPTAKNTYFSAKFDD